MSRSLFVLFLLASTPAISFGQDGSPDTPPQWWKGNLHTHSLWSDGNDFPEMIGDWYRKQGYHFLALSDHNVLSRGERWLPVKKLAARGAGPAFRKYLDRFGTHWVELRDDPKKPGEQQIRLKPLDEVRALLEERGRFLMIEAEEITDRFESHEVHINASNIASQLKPQHGDSVRETIRRNFEAIEKHAAKTGREVLPHLNHPNFGWSITAEDMAAVLEERFFEVFNGHPGTMTVGDTHHVGTERLWDIANTIRVGEMTAPPLFAIATDDSHHFHGKGRGSFARAGRGWVQVRSRFLSPEHLIRAMKAGDFYASTGVVLERLDADEKHIEIEVRVVEGQAYTIEFIGTERGYDTRSSKRLDNKGRPVTRTYSSDVGRVLKRVEGPTARYDLTGRELYVRAVVRSTAPVADPSYEGESRAAWTQPVGWRSVMTRRSGPDSK